ncbi:MAG: Na/Pi cotransporter family protein [Bacillota bacterium]|nr:Na/Pi cotransporter family protein [Bacillota bacterium]
MNIFNIISLLGGLALFLYGMRIMGDGLKKESTGSFKTALEKVTNNPFMGFLIGAGLTAIIQSATATIVIVSGLVGAGIMSLTQSIGIILGANVGTTITGQIIRLLDVNAEGTAWLNMFKPNTLAPVAAIVGIIFVMFIKTKKSDTIGTIAMGFGILFTGLLNMTAAVAPLSENPQFTRLFISFGDQPILGFLVGFGVAFILQSSSATVGILQALSITGALTFASVYPIICGIYLGDCVTTALVCSIGTKPDAKRTGVVNILFNLSEIFIISVAVNVIHMCGGLTDIWNSVLNSGGIANTHTVFNLSCAIILLPLAKTYGKLAEKIVKDETPEPVSPEIAALDDKLFSSPALAFNSVYQALLVVHKIIKVNLAASFKLVSEFDDKVAYSIESDEKHVDQISDAVNNYLIRLSPNLYSTDQDAVQHYYLQCVTDLERSADHVYEISKCAALICESKISFSNEAHEQLEKIEELATIIVKYTTIAFRHQNLQAAKEVQPHCEVLAHLIDHARKGHMDRMIAGSCDSVSGSVFLDLLSHIGRVADMCSNIGIHTLARHSAGLENFEHEYISHLRHGDDEMFNARLMELERTYLH